MKINRVEIDNFQAIGEVTVDLDNKGLVLIQGENEDDSSQKSNGAGKSTVAEALSWAIYNTTAREESGDDVVNRTAKKDCRVLVQMVDGDRTFNVIRHRKHKDHKNRVLLLDVTDPLDPVDLTLGTDKATQDSIEKLIGCSGDVFRAAIYSGQEAQIDLPSLTDKHLKTIVEEAAGINKMQEAHQVARTRLGEAQTVFSTVNRDIQEQERLLTVFDGQLLAHIDNKALYEIESKAKIESTKVEANRLVGEIKAIKAKADAIDQDGLEGEKIVIEGNLSSVDSERVAYDKLTAIASAVQNEMNSASTELTNITTLAKRLKHSLEHVTDTVGSSCKECGHKISTDDVAPKKDATHKQLVDAVESSRPVKLRIAEITTRLDAANAAVAAFVFTDVSSSSTRLKEINDALRERQTLMSDMNSRLIMVRNLKASLSAESVNPHDSLIADAEKNIAGVRVKLDALAVAKEEAIKKVTLHSSVVEVFSPAGIRAQILDTVTPFLNDRTAKYLGILSDGNISAVWSTLSRTAKGELREKFEIAVDSKTGGSSYRSLSGGEKKKVRLSAALALQDLVSSRATKPIQLWIGDEIDDAVDESGLERLMTVLEEKAKEKGTVMIISHNPIRDWVRQHVTVKKEGGKATMTGCLCIDRETVGV